MSYYPQKLQDWVGSQSSSVPVGATFSQTRHQYGSLARRTAELRPALGSAVHRRRQHARFHHQHQRHTSAGARLQRRAARSQSHRRPGSGLEPDHRKGNPGQHGRADRLHRQLRRPAAAGDPLQRCHSRLHLVCDHEEAAADGRVRQRRDAALRSVRPTGTSPCMPPPAMAVSTACSSSWSGVSTTASGIRSSGISGNTFLLNRDTDDTQSLDAMPSINMFLPGAVPTDIDARNRFLNYKRDPNTPKHQIRWNFIAELPFGRGKKLLGNSQGRRGRSWSAAGRSPVSATLRQGYWSLPTELSIPTGNPIEIYGFKYPIQDCQSGTCFPGYLWWNGYIPANRINSVDANGKPNGIMGVPSNYKPAAAPLIPWGQTALPANAPADTDVSRFLGYQYRLDPAEQRHRAAHGLQRQPESVAEPVLLAPWQWFQDASAFKFITRSRNSGAAVQHRLLQRLQPPEQHDRDRRQRRFFPREIRAAARG